MTTMLTGCPGGSVKIAGAAVRNAGHAVGNDSLTVIELSSDDVGRLAREADVPDDVIRDVAPKLDEQNLWEQSVNGARSLYEQTPEEVRGNLVGLACDGLDGEITSREQLAANVAERFREATREEQDQLVLAVTDMWNELFAARTSDDPEAKAAAVIACFTVEQAVG